jgi:hypothetical protein
VDFLAGSIPCTDSGAVPLSGELIFEPSAAPAKPPRGRRADRISVQMGAGIRQRGAAGVSANIMDLSTDGFRCTTHLELQIGADVWLRLPGLESTHARVVWVEGPVVGCAFSRALHPAVLEMVVQRVAQGGS